MTEATTVEKLCEMRALLAKGWTQGAFARAADGDYVHVSSDLAVCFCLIGAARCVRLDDYHARLSQPLSAVLGSSGLTGWNDEPERTHADVLALVDLAIAAEVAR